MSLKAQSTSRSGTSKQRGARARSTPPPSSTPVRRVGARDPVAGDEVGRRRSGTKPLELGQVELQVGVGEEHPRQARRGEPERTAAP